MTEHRPRALRDRLAASFGIEELDKTAIYASVAASASLRDPSYWAELILSAGIATLGLTLGSPAVIIGAMLISPLMNPIMAGGLALAAGDLLLAIRSTVSIFLSSIVAIGFSTLLVTLLPFREMTNEIASRTTPNTLDLVIALFSGAVGALAVCKSVRGVATSIPGVAIAVALMPPLCVSGYGLGVILTVDRVQGMAVLRGGSLLFVTNLVAITLASMLVFLMLHIDAVTSSPDIPMRRAQDRDLVVLQETMERIVPEAAGRIGSLPARLVVVFGLLLMVFFPLKRSFDALASEIRQRQELNSVQRVAQSAWEEMFGRSMKGDPRSYIDRFDAVEHDGSLRLTVRAFTSAPITPVERENYLTTLARDLKRNRSKIELAVIEIPTSQYQVARAAPTKATPVPPLSERLDLLSAEMRAVVNATALPPGTILIDSTTVLAERPEVTISYLGPSALSADAAALVAADVRRRLSVDAAVVFEQITMYQPADAESLASVVQTLQRHPRLRAVVRSTPKAADDAIAAIQALVASGAEPARVRGESVPEAPDALAVILEPIPLPSSS